MLRRIFVAIGVSVMVLGGVLSAQADDQGNVKQHQQILNAVNAVQAAVDALSAGAQPPCGAGTAGQRFVVSQDSTEVCDNTTGLNWQKNPDSITRTQADALVHCPTVRPSSRLPEVKELISLVDYSQFNPTLPVGHPFTNVQLSGYWSATTFVGIPAHAWRVHFDIGVVNANVKTNAEFVWCVRGAM